MPQDLGTQRFPISVGLSSITCLGYDRTFVKLGETWLYAQTKATDVQIGLLVCLIRLDKPEMT